MRVGEGRRQLRAEGGRDRAGQREGRAGRVLGAERAWRVMPGRPLGRPARDFAREPLFIDAQTPLPATLTQMRQTRTQLAVITRDGVEVGVLSLDDILPLLMPSALVGQGTPES